MAYLELLEIPPILLLVVVPLVVASESLARELHELMKTLQRLLVDVLIHVVDLKLRNVRCC